MRIVLLLICLIPLRVVSQEIPMLISAESTLTEGDTTQSLILFQEVLKQYPDSYIAALRLCEINYERGIYNESIQFANIADDILGYHLDSLDEKTYLSEEDSIRKHVYEEDKGNLHFLKGKIRLEQIRYEDARMEFKKALETIANPSYVYLNIGLSYLREGSHTEAIEAFREAVTQDPGNTAALMNLGNIYFNEGELISASFFYLRAVEIDPGLYEAYNYLGAVATSRGEYVLARDYYDNYLEQNESEEILFKRAVVQAELLKWDDSIDDWDRVIELNPENVEAIRNRGLCYFQVQDYRSAISDFSRAIEIRPEPYTYINRGYSYLLLDEPKLALEDLNTGLEELPDYQLGYYFRGLTYRRLREKKQACNDLSKAIELGMEEIEIDPEFLAACN